jgi:hypothetical protein
MFHGPALTELVRDFLFFGALSILETKKGKYKFDWDNNLEPVAGIIKTDFKCGSIGTFAGVIFQAEFETAAGKGNTTFLVDGDATDALTSMNPAEIAWFRGFFPTPEEKTFASNGALN